MRKKLVAGNWKMNLSRQQAKELVKELISGTSSISKTDILVIPPFVWLTDTDESIGNSNIKTGAQNCAAFNNGAYTGEVSATMLSEINIEYALIGHSERRAFFKETNEMLLEKTYRLLENNIIPIYCIGETLSQREAQAYYKILEQQLNEVVFKLSEEQFKKVIIAYEPVWAIGTGKTASKEQAQEIHFFIRDRIKNKFGSKIAEAARIIYGGSCNPANASELFAQPDVDGGLIGGASLKATDFTAICKAAEAL